MAYKFQRGDAILSGSLIQSVDIIADTGNDITGSDIVVTSPGCEIKSGDDLTINNGDLLMESQDATIGNSIKGGRAFLSASGDHHASLTIQHSDDTTLLKMGSAVLAAEGVLSEGFLTAFDESSNRKAHLSGSGNGLVSGLQVGSQMLIGQDLIIGGDLTVVTKTDLTANRLVIEDPKAQIKADAADAAGSFDTGFIFGNAPNRAQILFKNGTGDSDVSEAAFFGIFADTDSSFISVSASTYYGDGSNLEGISSAPTFSVTEKIEDDSIAVGVSYVTGAIPVTLTVPTGSSLASGAQFKIKSYGQHDETNKITISRTGTDTIDGQVSIDLESAFASVTIVYTGNGEFGVI